MTPDPTIPLYIADQGERLIEMLVDEAFKWLVEEVENEEKQNDQSKTA